jgi:hypothetical protein
MGLKLRDEASNRFAEPLRFKTIYLDDFISKRQVVIPEDILLLPSFVSGTRRCST